MADGGFWILALSASALCSLPLPAKKQKLVEARTSRNAQWTKDKAGGFLFIGGVLPLSALSVHFSLE
jgi:hypothetical protein